MNARMTHTAVEIALVLAIAGLFLELVNSQSWAVIVVGVAALAWLQVRRQ
jgi:hypothetical protein